MSDYLLAQVSRLPPDQALSLQLSNGYNKSMDKFLGNKDVTINVMTIDEDWQFERDFRG